MSDVKYFCSKCGREITDANACCGYCGTWHGYSSSRRTPAVIKCRKCGRALSYSRCGYCGTNAGRGY